MDHHKPVHIRQIEPRAFNGAAEYPGLDTQTSSFLPENQYSSFLPAKTTPSKSFTSLLSNLNFKDIKAMVDRMGGIEGILNTVSKVQKVIETMQQFGPMLKMLIPKFGAKSARRDNDDDYPRRRRRRRRVRRRRRRRPAYSYYAPRRIYRRRRLPKGRRKR